MFVCIYICVCVCVSASVCFLHDRLRFFAFLYWIFFLAFVMGIILLLTKGSAFRSLGLGFCFSYWLWICLLNLIYYSLMFSASISLLTMIQYKIFVTESFSIFWCGRMSFFFFFFLFLLVLEKSESKKVKYICDNFMSMKLQLFDLGS